MPMMLDGHGGKHLSRRSLSMAAVRTVVLMLLIESIAVQAAPPATDRMMETGPQAAYDAQATRRVVFDAFRKPGATTIRRTRSSLSVELVDQDGLFSFYEANRTQSEPEVWDLIFLDQYFETPPSPRFTSRNGKLARLVLGRYLRVEPSCQSLPGSRLQARCVFDYLARRNVVYVGGGRYDEGYRCMVWQNHPERAPAETQCLPY